VFVLGIDPGLSRCGFAVVEPDGRGRGRAVAIGVITTPAGDPTPVRLAEVQREVRSLIREYHPAVVAIERIFFQNNVRTAVSVAQVSGVVIAESVAGGADVAEYSPNQIKAAVAGDGRADKRQMQDMVKVLLNLSSFPKPADAADAAAIALCHLATDPSGFLANRVSARIGPR
jgi:crossover junction endodeoxyribonuclease RuvC